MLSCWARPRIAIAMLTGSALLMSGGLARAAPLDDAACTALQAEHEQLVLAGVKESMAQGPDWAKANLPASRLKEIERLIEIEEGLLFRCPRPKAVEETAEDESDGAAPAAKEKARSSQAAAVPVPVRKPKLAKPKHNDAYVPPPKPKPSPRPAPTQ